MIITIMVLVAFSYTVIFCVHRIVQFPHILLRCRSGGVLSMICCPNRGSLLCLYLQVPGQVLLMRILGFDPHAPAFLYPVETGTNYPVWAMRQCLALKMVSSVGSHISRFSSPTTSTIPESPPPLRSETPDAQLDLGVLISSPVPCLFFPTVTVHYAHAPSLSSYFGVKFFTQFLNSVASLFLSSSTQRPCTRIASIH